MGKGSRKIRRQARRARRKERRALLQELIGAIKGAKITFKPDAQGTRPTFDKIFKQIWPVLDPALRYAVILRVTGDRVDKVLEDIHKVGSDIAAGNTGLVDDFRQKFRAAWDNIESKLELIQLLTPNSVDNIIDDVIEIGDWVAGE